MGRSLSFGSIPCDYGRPIQTRFRYGSSPEGINLATENNSPVHYAKGTRSHPVVRRRPTVLPLLVGIWFQVLLTPLVRVLFTFQSPYLSTIGCRVVLSLGGWSPLLHTEFHELRATLGHLSTESYCRRIRDCHPLWSAFPDCSASNAFVTPRGPATPDLKAWFGLGPLSLAATYGVSVDFYSCRYLDVSVPCVGSTRTMHSSAGDTIYLRSDAGLPHSEIPGSKDA